LVIGKAAIVTALKEGEALDRIYIDQLIKKDFGELNTLATQQQVPLQWVPKAKLNSLNAGESDGFIAIRAKVQYMDLQQMISWVVEKGETALFLILDGITDVRNIGGIARTAYAMGVHAIIIPDRGIASLNEDALLTSAGALEKIPVCRVNSLMKAVDELRLNGIKVFAADMKGSTKISDADLSHPSAIVIGSEDKGIYPALLKICDEKIKIPMPGDFESLNVSVATGVILYEAVSQRTKK
jgi:23S rRNA (guanosine2251-2'-O)-methyltransferase